MYEFNYYLKQQMIVLIGKRYVETNVFVNEQDIINVSSPATCLYHVYLAIILYIRE